MSSGQKIMILQGDLLSVNSKQIPHEEGMPNFGHYHAPFHVTRAGNVKAHKRIAVYDDAAGEIKVTAEAEIPREWISRLHTTRVII